MRNRLHTATRWPARSGDRMRLAHTTVEFVHVMERIHEYDDAVCATLDELYKAAIHNLTLVPFDPAEHGGEG